MKKFGLNLAFTGTIKDEILDKEEIAFFLAKYLINNHLKNLCERYKLDEIEIKEIIEKTEKENQAILEILELIGKSRGCLSCGRKNR